MFGIVRTAPAPSGLTLHLSAGSAGYVLDALVPRPEEAAMVEEWNADPVIGVPGLRCRLVDDDRVEIHLAGSGARIEARLPREERAEVAEWIAALEGAWGSLHDRLSETEARFIQEYRQRNVPATEMSRALRRLPAFRDLPGVDFHHTATVHEVGGGLELPDEQDFAVLAARGRSRAPRGSAHRTPGRRTHTWGKVLAVVGGHGAGGAGRSTVAASLAMAAAGQGRRVLVVNTDSNGMVRDFLEPAAPQPARARWCAISVARPASHAGVHGDAPATHRWMLPIPLHRLLLVLPAQPRGEERSPGTREARDASGSRRQPATYRVRTTPTARSWRCEPEDLFSHRRTGLTAQTARAWPSGHPLLRRRCSV
ncbi:hypothetical protein KV557_40595 [Kitasatospora aureofaciens]|nr:hypothetical protein [Kitasatospora aureofaciens]